MVVMVVLVKLTSNSFASDTAISRLLVVQIRNLLVDLGPHVLQALGRAAGHAEALPVDLLAVFLELGDDAEEELELFFWRVSMRRPRSKRLGKFTLASSVQALEALPFSLSDMAMERRGEDLNRTRKGLVSRSGE